MEHDALAFRTDWASDHFPVIATLETAPSRDPSPQEAKIDPVLYNDPDIRKEVRRLWKLSNDSYGPEYDNASRWDAAKQIVASFLM